MHQLDTIDSAPTELLVWEAEGGAVDAPRADAGWPSAIGDTALLARLGMAVVGEWHNLTTPLRRAVYDRAAPAHGGRGSRAVRRRLARYLHDHKSHAGRG
jgi:hypothetical protein